MIGSSYFEYLHLLNKKIDFSVQTKDEYDAYNEDSTNHVPFSIVNSDDFFSEIKQLAKGNVSFFDFGCGKGAALYNAYIHGIRKIGGVELIPEVYNQAIINFKELGVTADIYNDNAINIRDVLDDYNCFFFYNPFTGETFRNVIENIKESYFRKPRTIYILYANPFEHTIITQEEFFTLIKQLHVDLYDPLLNIYVREG